MAVRANKPAFNIREKLKELTHSIGLKGRELMRAETAQEARDLVSAGRKNIIINGDMSVSQRVGTTATTTGAGTFVIDRMRWENSNSGSTTAQQVTDAPPGFHNSMKITVTGTDTSVASGEYSYFRHIIEGNNMNHLKWGSSNAKPVTLSFWAKSSVMGDHGGSLWNDGFNRSFPFNYTINSANAWEHKSITVPGCPDGTWEVGVARGINIGFVQLSGSAYTGTPNQWNSAGNIAPTSHVNLLATNGATLYITGIQLEVGKNATDFEHRSIGEELALCQRYFQKIGGEGRGGSADYNNYIASGFIDANGSEFYGGANLKVSMRTSPTITFDGTISTLGYTQPGLGIAANNLTSYWSCPQSYVIRISSTASGGTTGFGAYARVQNDNSQLNFSAEL
jgi:hypothetical protein